ncbi:hypothetical protein JYK14_18005 [Siccirubricoccus sp. KC 17139]|uniref:SPOR domain-containing protein n=1 Tax=Siccirubricoccus soli TaxID=2899147 RepID=A0ABT1D7X5_9PROT|nr:hypothetical protein [Siccirubricoccus soli]MCO6418040.1 hypothetical protein [Siccirubricoccus soli]MCP2684175.1 hypothetical protein [Siccirubricoccus soli]
MLTGAGLLVLGGVAGYGLGVANLPPLAQRPFTMPAPDAAGLAEAPAPQRAAPDRAAADADLPSPAMEAARDHLASELAALRNAVAEETEKLAEAMLARSEAEAELALLRRRQGVPSAETPEAARVTAEAPAAARELPPPPDPPRDAAPRREREAPPREAAPRQTSAVEAPRSGTSRVFVHFPSGSAGAAEAASGAAALVRDAGFELGEMRAVSAAPAHRVVRYFHAADAPAAARLAGRLGRGWAIQDFRGYEPAPPPQTLELWLPDR